METQFPVHELGEAEGDIVNCESVPGKTGSLSGSSYSSHSMMAIHYVPLSPRRRRLARFIFATLLIVGSLGSCAANATSIEGADPTTAKEPAAESVLVGLHVERISEVNDTARTFTAEFELGLRYRGAFDPKDLSLLDTLQPLVLDQPEESTDRDGKHFRLFHLNATFRFNSVGGILLRVAFSLFPTWAVWAWTRPARRGATPCGTTTCFPASRAGRC